MKTTTKEKTSRSTTGKQQVKSLPEKKGWVKESEKSIGKIPFFPIFYKGNKLEKYHNNWSRNNELIEYAKKQKINNNWEKEFDKLWRDFEEEHAYGYPEQKEKVLAFISQNFIFKEEIRKLEKKRTSYQNRKSGELEEHNFLNEVLNLLDK